MPYCIPLKDAFRESKRDIGNKAYNLSLLLSFGFPIPKGFVIKAQGFSDFLAHSLILEKIQTILSGTDVDDTVNLSGASHEIKKAILSTEIPEHITQELTTAYTQMSEREEMSGLNDIARSIMGPRNDACVAIRGSVPCDEFRNSFAGCAHASLNVRGKIGFFDALKNVWASFYSEHAIYYREKTGNQNAGLAILVQQMIHPEKSGAIFTSNPVTGNINEEVVEAIWGTGEALSLGVTAPDRALILKDSRKITQYSIGKKEWLYAEGEVNGGTRKEAASEKMRDSQVLSDDEIHIIEEVARKIEERARTPQDVGWVISKGRMYIIEARPVITGPPASDGVSFNGNAHASGVSASQGAAEGSAKILYDPINYSSLAQGDILVSRDASGDVLPAAKRASAVICETGGILSPAATLLREFRVPMIVGVSGITITPETLGKLRVDATKGKIYLGAPEENLSGFAGEISLPAEDYGNDSNGLLLATKIRVGIGSFANAENVSDSDGIFVLGDGAQSQDITLDIAHAAERSHPSSLWLKMPKADNADFSGISSGILGAMARGHRNICALIPSVYSRAHVEEARSVLASAGISAPTLELGIIVDSPAGAVMACEFAQAGVTVVGIDSDAFIKNMFGLPDGASTSGLEMHPAFLQILERCIRACRKQKMHTALFGRAAGDQRMIERLVEFGIDSICVAPEQAKLARYMTARAERKMLITILKNRDKFFRNGAE